MIQHNKLNQVPLANVNREELEEIKKLEEKLDDKYYLIAFDKNGHQNNRS